MGTIVRYVIAAAAVSVLAVRFFAPDLKLDLTTFALIGITLLAIFARNIRIKAFELMGVKVEIEALAPASGSADPTPAQRKEVEFLPRSSDWADPTPTQRKEVEFLPPSSDWADPTPTQRKEVEFLPQGMPVYADDYLTRYRKLVPIENITGYAIFVAMFDNLPNSYTVYLVWFTFIAFLIMVPVLYHRALGVWDAAAKWQTAFAMLNFCAWAYAIGGPFKSLSWYNPALSGFLLMQCTLILPIALPRHKS